MRAGNFIRRLAAAALVLTASVGLAANLTVRPASPQGWTIIPDGTVAYGFDTGAASIGTGSLAFGPIDGSNPANKFIMMAPVGGMLASDLTSFSLDFYVDPASLVGSDNFYFNVYVDSAANGVGTTASFYDCRYDLVSPAAAPTGVWLSLSFTSSTTAWTNIASPLANCPTSLGALPAGSTILFLAVNGGQSTAADAGLLGRFDRAQIVSTAATDTYDFEPDLVIARVPPAPVPTLSEFARFALAALLAAAAAIVLRRRRASKARR